jgi:hypothetical protein
VDTFQIFTDDLQNKIHAARRLLFQHKKAATTIGLLLLYKITSIQKTSRHQPL